MCILGGLLAFVDVAIADLNKKSENELKAEVIMDGLDKLGIAAEYHGGNLVHVATRDIGSSKGKFLSLGFALNGHDLESILIILKFNGLGSCK